MRRCAKTFHVMCEMQSHLCETMFRTKNYFAPHSANIDSHMCEIDLHMCEIDSRMCEIDSHMCDSIFPPLMRNNSLPSGGGGGSDLGDRRSAKIYPISWDNGVAREESPLHLIITIVEGNPGNTHAHIVWRTVRRSRPSRHLLVCLRSLYPPHTHTHTHTHTH